MRWILCTLLAAAPLLAGCQGGPEPALDPATARASFHYHRSFRFDAPDPELRFELGQLAVAAAAQQAHGYVSTKEGRWALLAETLDVDHDLEQALDDLERYLSERDVEVPAREIYPLVQAIERLRRYARLSRANRKLRFHDPALAEKAETFLRLWQEYNQAMRAYLRAQQAVPLQEEVLEYVLRFYYSNFETLWGLPRRRPDPPAPVRRVFLD